MERQCEVCREFRPEAAGAKGESVRERAFGKRNVLLCPLHTRLVQVVRVTTFEGLRKLFRESRGKRSFVARRGPVASPAQTDRRARSGRRATDV